MHYCLAYVLGLIHLLIAFARLVLVRLPPSPPTLVAGRVGHGVSVRVRGHDDMWRYGVARGWLVVGRAERDVHLLRLCCWKRILWRIVSWHLASYRRLWVHIGRRSDWVGRGLLIVLRGSLWITSRVSWVSLVSRIGWICLRWVIRGRAAIHF